MSTTRPEINLHPTTNLPSTLKAKTYDVVVIGGGTAGEGTAARVAKHGISALLVESELVGGECPYWACVPSKALLRPSETIESAKAVGGARERLALLAQKYGAKPEIDLEGTWARRDRFTKGWKDGAAVGAMEEAGVEVVRGFGSVSGVKKVSIRDWHSGGSVEVEARLAVVVSTGSAPVIPEIEGLKETGYWTPREAVSAKEVPDHLIVLGAGAVGTEMATVYHQLGSKVTLISGNERILPRVAPEASQQVHERLVDAGVVVAVNSKIRKVKRTGKMVSLTLSDGSTLDANELLIATGREARTHGVGLEKIGVPSEGAWVDVDYSMCARSVPDGWLYAVGDTNGRSPLTHMGKYQASIAAKTIVAKAKGVYQNALQEGFNAVSSEPSELAVPQVIFSDPQVASVGSSLEQAKAKNISAVARSVKMQGPGTFLHAEGYEGWAQWVFEEGNGKLLGATFVGRDVVDLLHASTVAVVGCMTIKQLAHAIPSFPTISEAYTTLVEACED